MSQGGIPSELEELFKRLNNAIKQGRWNEVDSLTKKMEAFWKGIFTIYKEPIWENVLYIFTILLRAMVGASKRFEYLETALKDLEERIERLEGEFRALHEGR
ncbi:MAG: hypothetical protein H3Z50_00970 [archaeon]|nr:hypothetical protein [archaeon]MCP8305743.1 hypothetical protein [archaeon]